MTSPASIVFDSFPVGQLQCNCSIIGDPVTKKGIIVDPGGNPEIIKSKVEEFGLDITHIIHTHAHYDHIVAAGEVKSFTGAQIGLHPEDEFLWDMLETQCQMFGFPYNPVPKPDFYLKDEHQLNCCGGVALHTPGHTPGSISFWFEAAKILVAGDTLFQRSIGRTDLWGGDFEAIQASIQNKLYTLADDALVVTGHGPNTSLAEERDMNPFVRG